ncbi:MAG: Flp pilus assembly protein TadD [Paracoccaceae bacterium]|jgi:Flp pilus assembly protein TadD
MTDLAQAAFDAYRAGDFAGAEAAYRRLLEQNPEDLDSRMTLGVVLRRLGRLDEAISLLDDVAKAAPDDFRAFANLGLALQTAKRLDDAIAAYRQAYQLEPRTIRQIAVNLSALGTGMLFLDPRQLEAFLARN